MATIILTGIVDSIEDAQRAGDIAKGFVQRASAGGPPGAPGASGVSTDGRIVNVLTIRTRDQVMLKVTVAEVDRNIAKQLGITTSSLTPVGALSPNLIRSR
jgi:pilus assembly protein CpaC